MASVKKPVLPVKSSLNSKVGVNAVVKPTTKITVAKKIIPSKPDLLATKKPSLTPSTKSSTLEKPIEKLGTVKSLKPSVPIKATTAESPLKAMSKQAPASPLKADGKPVVVKRVPDSTTKPEVKMPASAEPSAVKNPISLIKMSTTLKATSKTAPPSSPVTKKTVSVPLKVPSLAATKNIALNTSSKLANTKPKSVPVSSVKSVVKVPLSPRPSVIKSSTTSTSPLPSTKLSSVGKTITSVAKSSTSAAKPKLTTGLKIADKSITPSKSSAVKPIAARTTSTTAVKPSIKTAFVKKAAAGSTTIKSIRNKPSPSSIDVIKRIQDESEIEIRDADSTTSYVEEHKVFEDFDSIKLCTCKESQPEVAVDEERVYLVAEQLFNAMQSEQVQDITEETVDPVPAKTSDSSSFIIDMSMIEMEEGRTQTLTCTLQDVKPLETIMESEEQECIANVEKKSDNGECREIASSVPEVNSINEDAIIQVCEVNETQNRDDNVMISEDNLIKLQECVPEVVEQVFETLLSKIKDEEMEKAVEVFETTTMIEIHQHDKIVEENVVIEETEYNESVSEISENNEICTEISNDLKCSVESENVLARGSEITIENINYAIINKPIYKLKNESLIEFSRIDSGDIETKCELIDQPLISSLELLPVIEAEKTQNQLVDFSEYETSSQCTDVANEIITEENAPALITFDEKEIAVASAETEIEGYKTAELVADQPILVDLSLESPKVEKNNNLELLAEVEIDSKVVETLDDIVSVTSSESLSYAEVVKNSIEFGDDFLFEEKIEDIQEPAACILSLEDEELQLVIEDVAVEGCPKVQPLYDLQELDFVVNDENFRGQDHVHSEIDNDEVNLGKIMHKKNKKRNKKNRKSSCSNNNGFQQQYHNDMYNKRNPFPDDFNGRRRTGRKWRYLKNQYQDGFYPSNREYYAENHWKFS